MNITTLPSKKYTPLYGRKIDTLSIFRCIFFWNWTRKRAKSFPCLQQLTLIVCVAALVLCACWALRLEVMFGDLPGVEEEDAVLADCCQDVCRSVRQSDFDIAAKKHRVYFKIYTRIP